MAPTILLVAAASRRTVELEQALHATFPEARVELTGGSIRFAELSAIARRESPPRVVLVDLEEPESGVQLLAKAHVALPRAVVAAYAPAANAHLRSMVLKAGAVDLLSPPYRLDLLARSVARATQPGRLLAFVPSQGGSGSSTIALHVAAAIAAQLPEDSRGVCLADFDFQAGVLAFRLRLKPALCITDLLASPKSIHRILPQAVVRWRGIDVLAAPESETNAAAGDATPTLIAALRERYEVVILDMPAGLYASCRDALQPDVEAFLVTTPDATPLSLAERRARELLELGVSSERIHVVYNRSPRQPAAESLNPTLAALGEGTCVPNSYQTLNLAVLSGGLAPFDSPVGRAYLALAQRVLSRSTASGAARLVQP